MCCIESGGMCYSGFLISLASYAVKKYVNGVNITFKQINALKQTLKLGCVGIVSGLTCTAVSLSSEKHTVPVTCNIVIKVTEMIGEATLSLCPWYVTQNTKRILKHVLNFIWHSTEHLKCIVYDKFNHSTSHSWIYAFKTGNTLFSRRETSFFSNWITSNKWTKRD